jgi:hemolysin activation/secretion protein
LEPPAGPTGETPVYYYGAPLFTLKGVVIEGNRLLPESELADAWEDLLGEPVTFADLEQIRYRLTRHYVDRGYVSSGFVLKPGQDVTDGVVAFQALEGRIEEVRIQGTGGLHPDYVRGRLLPDPGTALDLGELQDRFELLLDDPLIERMHGRLVPGSARLEVEVERARPYELMIRSDNYRPPSTGAERGYLGAVLRNLTGWGDALELYGGLGYEGQGNELAVGYAIPIGTGGARLGLRYERSDSSLLEEPLRELEIESETEGLELALSYPIVWTLRRTIALGVLLGRYKNETSLLDVPFSFSPGAVRGESRVSAVRLFQDILLRDPRQALALRSVLSLGVDTLDATIHGDDRPDSQFVAWLVQAQYARRLGDRGAELILRGGFQVSGDPLLPLEQFAIGGVGTVRGYRENEQVGDDGYAASVELRYPLWRGKLLGQEDSLIQGAVFADIGKSWMRSLWPDRPTLYSVGLGLLWSWGDGAEAELYWGYPLVEPVEPTEYNLQDDGIHFMLTLGY